MKKCNECECLFDDKYEQCPSCKSKDCKEWVSKNRYQFEALVVAGDNDDFGGDI